MRDVTGFIVLLSLTACGSITQDVTAMCTTPKDVEDSIASIKADPVQRVHLLLEHDEKVVRSNDGKALIKSLTDANHSYEERATRMQDEATKAGVASCPFVSDLRAAGKYMADCANTAAGCR